MAILSRKEQKRLVVLNQVEMVKMIGREAAEVLALSHRQTKHGLELAKLLRTYLGSVNSQRVVHLTS